MHWTNEQFLTVGKWVGIRKVKREWQSMNGEWKIRVHLEIPHHQNSCISIVQVSNSFFFCLQSFKFKDI